VETTREFFMWGHPAEIVARVKHRNGTVIEVPISNVEYRADRYFSELHIPLKGLWFDKLIETHDFSSMKRGG
jgi:hypothetical protein